MATPGVLSAARYGKDLVRLCRVVRDKDQHHVAEYTIRVMLEGDIETSYTKADNSPVVATDTMKNTCYYLAKTSPHVLDPPAFALHLALHFVNKYAHIHKCFIDIIALKWSRIEVAGKPHKWAFVRDGDEKGIISCGVDASAGVEKATATLGVGMKDLLVLKTGGSAFEGFHRDEMTTLPDLKDRLFSTSVTVNYDLTLPPNIPLTIDNVPKIAKEMDFAGIATKVKTDVMTIFAEDESASVQATVYNTLQKMLVSCPAIKECSMALPNKHYIAVNLSPFGLDNGLGYEGGAEVFHPVADPSGYITATVTRK